MTECKSVLGVTLKLSDPPERPPIGRELVHFQPWPGTPEDSMVVNQLATLLSLRSRASNLQARGLSMVLHSTNGDSAANFELYLYCKMGVTTNYPG